MSSETSTASSRTLSPVGLRPKKSNKKIMAEKLKKGVLYSLIVFAFSFIFCFISMNHNPKLDETEKDNQDISNQTLAYCIDNFSNTIISKLHEKSLILEGIYYNVLTSIFSASIFNLVYIFEGSLLSSFLISVYFICDNPFQALIRSNASDYIVLMLTILCFMISVVIINADSLFYKYLSSFLSVATLIIIGFIRVEAVVPAFVVFILSFFQAFYINGSFLSFTAFGEGLAGAIGSITVLVFSVIFVIIIGSNFEPPSYKCVFDFKSAVLKDLFANNHNYMMFPIFACGFVLFIISKQEGREYSEILFVGVVASILNALTSQYNQPLFDALYISLISMIFACVSLSRTYISVIICIASIPIIMIIYFYPKTTISTICAKIIATINFLFN